MNKMNNKIIKDYILGRGSAKSQKRLAEWLQEGKENQHLLFRMEAAYHEGRGDYEPAPGAMEKAEASLFDAIGAEQNRTARLHRLALWRRAAVALLLVAGGVAALWGVYGRLAMVTVTASADSVTAITLPDSTKVWLNHGGSLTYPKEFRGRERHVKLDGEALFSVTKNAERPFVVSSYGVDTRVLGTVFNFNTNCADNCEEVSLLEGRLEISGRGGEGKVIIKPNQKAVVDKTRHTMEVKNVYAPLEAVWHDGMIPFANMSIADIAHVLEKFYHVRITLSDNLDLRSTYSGYIRRNGNIDSVLGALSYSIPFSYSKQGSHITLSGR